MLDNFKHDIKFCFKNYSFLSQFSVKVVQQDMILSLSKSQVSMYTIKMLKIL